ncbi:MAG: HalX domain-containing protein [Natronomonas sp.]|uniref:HalX domain-containing protein n=1 Tax=Natronomonas sp. TaxID=2184060 RepID=UPI00286FE03C|nr:HalX domain-containing protein [Natronomonas sp.]MDR9429585.1 HalX domain-containing protein [Natronomonas sp.]
MPDPPVILVITPDPTRSERVARWLGNTHTVRKAADRDAALQEFDTAVDVVLVDQELSDVPREELLGQLKALQVGCQYVHLVTDPPGLEETGLGVDERVRKPLDREELRSLVTRLEKRKDVQEAVDSYFSALSKRRALEAEMVSDPENDPRYRALSGELLGRRRQIESLLTQVEKKDHESPTVNDRINTEPTPLYRANPYEFYGLWLFAALTYGVGDLFSTAYPVLVVPGIEEANPIVDTLLMNFGIGGFLFFKLFVFLILITISVQGGRTADRFSYYWPPLLATVLGAGLTVWNLRLIG